MNTHGQVEPTKIVEIVTKNNLSRWKRLESSRLGIGRGSSFSSIFINPDMEMPILGADNEVMLTKEVKIGDELYVHRSECALSIVGEQILIGKMLGDASLTSYGAGSQLSWGQVKEEYTDWTCKALGNQLASSYRDAITSGYGSKIYRGKTITSYSIKELFKDWFKDGKKDPPPTLIEKITPLAIAFWYMDDGNLSYAEGQEDRACFATNGFSENGVDILLKCLNKYSIRGDKYYSKGWRIRLRSDDAERLFMQIACYIPPFMQYKLPQRWQGNSGWFPSVFSEYKPTIRPQEVLSIEEVLGIDKNRALNVKSPRGSTGHGIITELGNYFANGILIKSPTN